MDLLATDARCVCEMWAQDYKGETKQAAAGVSWGYFLSISGDEAVRK